MLHNGGKGLREVWGAVAECGSAEGRGLSGSSADCMPVGLILLGRRPPPHAQASPRKCPYLVPLAPRSTPTHPRPPASGPTPADDDCNGLQDSEDPACQ